MNPVLSTFLRLTLVITAIIAGLFLLGFLLHIIVIAAVIAAVALGGLFLYNFFRRPKSLPVIR